MSVSARATPRTPVVLCLEGPSAVGKTTLADALGLECGAGVVHELDARDAPPNAEAEPWFVDRHAERWRLARQRAAESEARFAVLDGDPFKGLWYNWVFADAGWPGTDVVAPFYRAHLERETIGFPEAYVVLGTSVEALRSRRVNDPTRARRGFENNLRLIEPQRRYFTELAAVFPGRVIFLDSSNRSILVHRVRDALTRIADDRVDPRRLFEHMAEWIRTNAPT